MSREQLIKDIEDAQKIKAELSKQGILQYLQQIIINCRPEPAPFREKADSWQWSLVGKLIPAIEQVARVRQDYEGPTSFWFTLPRGHDKTSFIGRLLNWILAFSRITVDCVAAAADRDQAKILADAMGAEARLNPWLDPFLKFKNYEVRGLNESVLRIVSSDGKSNFGLNPDIIICDELTQWDDQANWDALLSARRKRGAHAILIVITNAGVQNTWQWDILKEAKRQKKSWFVYEAPGQICSWQTKEQLDEIRKMILPLVAKRMIDNVWLDPSEGCGFCTRDEAEACIDPELICLTNGKPGVQYIASIDYAPVRDRTAMAVLHQEPDGTAIIDRLDVLQGSRNRRVPITDVEGWLDRQRVSFGLVGAVIDPYQMESTIQKYQLVLPVIAFEARGGKGNYEMAATLRSAIINQKIRFPEDAGYIKEKEHSFVDELVELVVKEMSYGWRLDHLVNKHDDRAVAVGMGLVHLLKHSFKRHLFEGEYFW